MLRGMLEKIIINQLETKILISHLLDNKLFGKRETHKVFTQMAIPSSMKLHRFSSKETQLGHLDHVNPSKVIPA